MKSLTGKEFIVGTVILFAFIAIMNLGFNFHDVKANSAYTYNSKEFRSIISQLDMQGHADHDFSTCSIQKVYYEEVLEALNNGESEEEILQSYVDEYGQVALRIPATDGSGIIAWIMPAIGFLLGAIGVGYGIKKLINKNAQSSEMQFEELPEVEQEIVEQTFEEERRKYF